MRVWTYDVNYEHIRRLDWLIVLTCAVLAAVGQHRRPALPVVMPRRRAHPVAVSLTVLAVTAVVVLVVAGRWSPAQRMPSALSAEQVTAPAGADLALALGVVGPDGPDMLRRAAFIASDDTGRPIRANIREVENPATGRTMLLVILDPTSRPTLCGRTLGAPARPLPAKLTLRDRTSGLLVQATAPAEWCAR
jgi:hypothetical protein